MSLGKPIALETWLQETYGDDAPTVATARRWCRQGKIYPPAEKHGRSYFVESHARYTEGSPSLIDRLRADEAQARAS